MSTAAQRPGAWPEGDPNAITLPELGRRLDRLDSAVTVQFGQMRDEIRSMQFVPAQVFDAEKRALFDRIRQVDDSARAAMIVLADDLDEHKAALIRQQDRSRQMVLAIVSAYVLPILVAITLYVLLKGGTP